jgi:hypothetical protein
MVDREVLEFQKQLEQQMLFHYLQLNDKGEFVNPPRTDEELDEFIRLAYGVTFPKKVITPGHKTSFQFIADLFFERVKNALGFANRTGGKTYGVALLNHLDMIYKPGCEIASAGAVKDQANKCYRYFKEFCRLPWFQRLSEQHSIVTGKPLYREKDSIQTKTEFGNESLLEVITGSEKGFRGPHPHKSRIDEIDELEWDVFQTGLMMAHSSDEIRGQNVFTSTRQHAEGTMQMLLNEAAEKGIAIYEWNCWEMLERCPRRCKNDPVHGTCPIHTFCRGKAHACDGFYRIDDFVDKARLLDRDRFEIEWLNSKPARHKIVYPMFENSRHVLSKHDFAKLTGRPEPSWNWPMISSIDFGSSPGHPFVYTKYVRIPSGAWVIWWEYVAEQKLLRDHAAAIRSCPLYRPNEWLYADHDAQDRLELHALGIITRPAVKGRDSVAVGIDHISSLLKGFPPKEEPMLYVMDNCTEHIREFNLYSWPIRPDGKPDKTGRPKQEHDHCFVAGTKVLTDRGEVAIERIRSGDMLFTRGAWQRVQAAGMTAESAECFAYELPNGESVVCTPNHPFYTLNRGFVPVNELLPGDQLVLWRNASSSGLRSDAIRILAALLIEITSDVTRMCKSLARGTCIEQYGRTSTVKRYEQAGRSITLTGMFLTTACRTWRLLRRVSTYLGMLWKAITSGVNYIKSICGRLQKRLFSGIRLQRDANGIQSTPEELQQLERRLLRRVFSAERFSAALRRELSSAPTDASLHHDDERVGTRSLECASSASQSSKPCGSIEYELVLGVVPQNFVGKSVGRRAVFNITVDGLPEFFANGVLVHNCMDADRYALYSYHRHGGRGKYRGRTRRW